MAEILWARHGQNVANLTKTFSYRVFDGDLTDAGRPHGRLSTSSRPASALIGAFPAAGAGA